MLSDVGYEAIEAQSGVEALQLANAGATFDVLVTDFAMLTMPGVELPQAIRSVRADTPVLLITDFASMHETEVAGLPQLSKTPSANGAQGNLGRSAPLAERALSPAQQGCVPAGPKLELFSRRRHRHSNLAVREARVCNYAVGHLMKVNEVLAVELKRCWPNLARVGYARNTARSGAMQSIVVLLIHSSCSFLPTRLRANTARTMHPRVMRLERLDVDALIIFCFRSVQVKCLQHTLAREAVVSTSNAYLFWPLTIAPQDSSSPSTISPHPTTEQHGGAGSARSWRDLFLSLLAKVRVAPKGLPVAVPSLWNRVDAGVFQCAGSGGVTVSRGPVGFSYHIGLSMQGGSERTVLSRLAAYLEREQQSITEQWLFAVRRDPQIDNADKLTHQQLVDHLPQLYAELCAHLRARDAEVLHDEVKRDARKHGGHRWRDGYRLDEVLRELDILGRMLLASTLTRFGETEADFKGTIEITARTLVQEFFSAVTIGSAKQFMDEQQALTARHVEQLEQANQALQFALSQRQRLSTVVGHELRNFMQCLSSATRLSAKEPTDFNAHAATQMQIRDMHDLLQQLLDHSSAIGQAQPLVLEEFDPRAISEGLVAAIRSSALEKGLRLSLDCTTAPHSVIGDRLKTKQVLTNLLSNAIKYTAEGEVSLQVATLDEAQWRIEVSDTGPGMTAAAGARLLAGLGSIDEALPGRGIGLGITLSTRSATQP